MTAGCIVGYRQSYDALITLQYVYLKYLYEAGWSWTSQILYMVMNGLQLLAYSCSLYNQKHGMLCFVIIYTYIILKQYNLTIVASLNIHRQIASISQRIL